MEIWGHFCTEMFPWWTGCLILRKSVSGNGFHQTNGNSFRWDIDHPSKLLFQRRRVISYRRKHVSLIPVRLSRYSADTILGHTWNDPLAHLSQKLIGELIVYSCSGVRPSVVFSNIFSETAWPIKAIFGGASMSKGNESLFAAFGPHDQDSRHAHIR